MIKLMEKVLILTLMVLNILEIGKMTNKKVLVKKYGLMVPDIKVLMSKERNKVKANFIGLTDLNMKENFKIIIYMVKEFTPGLMEEHTKVNGKVIKWMEKENSYGLMVENMLDPMSKIKNMDSENLNGLMAEDIKDYGKMENNMEREFILMHKEKKNKENGLMVKE
eukprot:CAMPEP_0204821078 /NCGR_PEP_ID=MMETSP1018-20131115/2213_1 /ASSEMBLY_ACC=CAM_ASM_000518 /TAXON_ID=46462 /ORGANISM="Anophryoides haemophila, Strain AH6" /LENGTH=165 /DNA_ID=CAMNT_0051919671 /DNA_START=559 /DNA_END=1056 /DNA_ORIENTATION=-